MRQTDTTLVDRAADIARAVDDMTVKVDALSARDLRRRIQLVLLTVSVVLDLALTGGFFIANDRTNKAVDQVEVLVAQVAEASSAQRAACLAANESATAQVVLWHGILALPKAPDAPETPPETLAEFDRLLADTFAQRDCDL